MAFTTGISFDGGGVHRKNIQWKRNGYLDSDVWKSLEPYVEPGIFRKGIS